MRILVTGATGFVGRHLIRRLAGHDVCVLARNPDRAHSILGPDVSVLTGDLRDQESVERACVNAELIYHLGAARDHWGRPYRWYHETNVTGTQNLLSAAARAGTGKIVYCSTVGVYGFDLQYLPVDEQHPYGERLSYYARSKRQAEEIARASGLPVVTVQPGWIYGPEDETGGVTRMLQRLKAGRFAFIGPGRNRIHLVYIDDVVDGLLAAGRSEHHGESFLLLGPQVESFQDTVNAMGEALQAPAPGKHVPYWAGRVSAYGMEGLWLLKNRLLGPDRFGDRPVLTRDTLDGVTTDYFYDTSKAAKLLGHQPKVDLRKGLARTIEWMTASGRLPEGASLAGRRT
jgi:nucleoside-diphosphate-sugar epimerase